MFNMKKHFQSLANGCRKMWDTGKRYAVAVKVAVVAVVTGVALLPVAAHAALSIEQQAVVDSITALITDLTSMAWTLVLSVTGTLIALKLFKRFAKSST